jgi:hypothetical protein
VSVQAALRSVYTRLSGVEAVNRAFDVVRRRPFVRRLARRHIAVLLSGGSTWVNVDGSLRLIAEDDHPVVFGPWRGDAVTELLYWIPFLRWAQAHFELDPARCVAMSRGGVGHWYAEVCERYVELLDHVDESELERVSADVVRSVPGLRDATVFPPNAVLDLVADYREGATGSRPFLKRTRHTRLPVPDDSVTEELPKSYVAIALAPTEALPGAAEHTAVVRRLVEGLAASTTIVSVDGGDWPEPVLTPLRGVPARRRLQAQHAVIARSRGLIAAFSELVPLGMLTGVPVIALRAAAGTIQIADLDMALLVGSESGGSLNVLELDDLASLHEVLDGDSPVRGRL